MPELPEVEIAARSLRAWLLDRRIEAYRVTDPMLTAGQSSEAWEVGLRGAEVLEVQRRAKYLVLPLSTGYSMVAHLRMTGRFIRKDYLAEEPRLPIRLTLATDAGHEVWFLDRRRFGRVWVRPTAGVDAMPELAVLGADAFDQPITGERLREVCQGARRSIKTLLMDQRVLGGIGNICAIEILYRVGVPPDVPAGELTPVEVDRIAAQIPDYLAWAIDKQSRRELLYIGERGAENIFTIYRRDGTPCPKCSSPIVRTVLAGRGTYHCPGCQPSRKRDPATSE